MADMAEESIFRRRMRVSRFRQFSVAAASLAASAIMLSQFSPDMIGGFAYYSIIALLVLNAILAMRLGDIVMRPIETLLGRLEDLNRRVEHGDYAFDRLARDGDDEAFACLAAGFDSIVERLGESTRVANERAVRYATILHSIPIALYVLSRQGKVLKTVKPADETEVMPGFTALALPDEKIWGRQGIDLFNSRLAESFASGEETLWLDLYRDVEGGRRQHYRISLRRLNDFSALMTARDITDVDERAESGAGAKTRLSRSQKIAALRRLAASVAHDGRNVFTILSNISALAHASNDPEMRSQADIADDAIRRGMNLLGELTMLAGEAHYHLVRRPAAETLRSLSEAPAIKALLPPNVHLRIVASHSPMNDIDIDVDQYWKVPFNLTKNAVEAFAGATGTIFVSIVPFTMTERDGATFRHAGALTYGPGVLVRRSDDGPGIAPEMLDHLFDPYFSSKGAGRGIGLATVMSIVDAHGGAIRVTSRLGAGTTFEIFLPSSRQAEVPAAAEALVKAAGQEQPCDVPHGGEVLIVDDDAAIAQTTKLILRALKFSVSSAQSCAEALRSLRTPGRSAEAAIVDAHVGNVTSGEFLRIVRGEFPKLRLILSSGSSEESLGAVIDRSLYDAFLAKPYSVTELKAALGA